MRGRYLVALVLVLAGLGLIANPYYLWPHYGDEELEELRVSQVDAANESELDVEPTALETLPSETRDALERSIAADANASVDEPRWPSFEEAPVAYTGEWPTFDRGETPKSGLDLSYRTDSNRPFLVEQNFGTTELVVADGDEFYTAGVVDVERSPPMPGAVRRVLGVIAALSIAAGAVVGGRGTLRFTTRSAWIVPGVWIAVLVGTSLYDAAAPIGAAGSGHDLAAVTVAAIHPLFVASVYLASVPAVGFVLGTAVARRRWRNGAGSGRELTLLVVATAGIGLVLVLPAFLLGYLAAESPSTGGAKSSSGSTGAVVDV